MKMQVLCKLSGMVLIGLMLPVISCASQTPASQPAPQKSSTPAAAAPVSATTPKVKPISYSAPPPMAIDTSKKYTAIMETAKGKLVIELFAKDVPKTVNNFVFLSREGFYDNTTFHRVIQGFMAQGGDPTGTGMGGPGYKFADEFTSHKHVTGSLSMANSGANTNGSQFFITYAPQSHLDGKHSVFGQLTEGMDVLKKLTPRDPSQNGPPGDKIIKVTIKEE